MLLICLFILQLAESKDSSNHAPIRIKSATGVDEEPVEMYELARIVKIHQYTLEFEPFINFSNFNQKTANLTFRGYVEIRFTVLKKTSTLWLNSENLNISTLTLWSTVNNRNNKELKFDNKNWLQSNLIKVMKSDYLKVGENYTLEMNYTGSFYKAGVKGIFYNSYKSDDGTTKAYISTNFQPTYSRRLMPNFDDPWFKASFVVIVKCPIEVDVYSNQQIDFVEHLGDHQKIVHFKSTPRMSSYLLTIVSGHLKHRDLMSKRGVLIRSIGIAEVEHLLNEPTKILSKCIDSIQSLFDTKYPMNKLDMFISPTQEGAVEDFGLIKAEINILQLPNSMTAEDKFYSSNLICHEASHMWFGNIITAYSWTDLFLHESFATYLSHRALQMFINETNYVEAEFLKTRQIGLEAMSKSSLPIGQKNLNFSDVIYEAGASVLRMLEAIIGKSRFMQILNAIINNHAYGSVDYNDLVDIIEKDFKQEALCGSLTIKEVINDFFTQGYSPIVTVNLNHHNNYTFTQQPSISSSSNKWNIPLFLSDETIIWLLRNGSLCSLDSTTITNITIFNYKSYTFATMRYSNLYWQRLLEYNFTKIDEITLFGLIQDLDLQSKHDKSRKLNKMLKMMIKRIFQDFNGNVSPHILHYLHVFNRRTQKSLVELAYKHVSWNQSFSWHKDHFSSIVIQKAVKFDVYDAKIKASNLFKQFKDDCQSLDDLETCNRLNANTRKAIYSEYNGNDYNFMKKYTNALKTQINPRFYFQTELDIVESAISNDYY